MKQILLSIQNLQVDFVSDEKTTTAIKDISAEVNTGDSVAIVGEAGSESYR